MAGSNRKSREHDFEEALRQFIDGRMRGEKPDIDEFVNQYPEFEDQIRQKVQSFHKIDALFDTLMQSVENEFVNTTAGKDLVGQNVGSFEIVEMIGKGGMGIVYLARDSKLDRLVAIKRLPIELQTSSTARTRFTREAKLLASLSHPNIGVIHDILEPTENNAYLVLEYIPGETLAERMAREPLQLKDALSMGLQIAEAVCAAHEAGVIHRDLKPSNIKITPDGRIKVLDFGLAKTSVSKRPGGEPTVTQAGRVMGTPAYMSPEQARGQLVDRRTDIWSYGCLLYEMLTGHLPFEGETTTDVLARIIEREPDWSLLPQATPSNIRILLWRCLAKDPHRRLQHIGDAVIEIDETLNVPPDKPSIAQPAAKAASRFLWGLGIVCAVSGLFLGLIAASLYLSKPAGPSQADIASVPTRRTVFRLPEDQVLGFYQATTFGIRRPAFALSPDGSRLVYAARVGDTTQLFERLMNRYEVRSIPGTDGASSPFFSPDGQSVGFFADEKLKRVSLRGGDPVILCNTGMPSGGSWSEDGMIYFCGAGVLTRVSYTSGATERLLVDFEPLQGGNPQVLFDGKAVLISSEIGAELVSLETMEKKVLVRDVFYARYVPTGHLVYVRAGALEAIPFSLETLQVKDPAVPVLEKVLSDSVYGSAQLAFSNDGTLVYVPGSDTGRSVPVWVDRQGNVEPLSMPERIYGTPKLSPDGGKLAIVVNELQSNVYIHDFATGTRSKLTLEGDNNCPVWTPDGKRVTFSHHTEGEENWTILWKPVDGSGDAELIHSSQYSISPGSWSADGKLLAFVELRPTNDRNIWVLTLEGDREPKLIVGTQFNDTFPAFSPNGRWIAYNSDRDGSIQVYVSPYPAMDRVWPISRDFGEESIWSNNGDELFYRSRDKWMVVPISTEPEFNAGKPQVVFEGPYINVGGLSYDVAPDGQRFLVLQPQFDDSQIRELHVVTNWFEELKRLVSSGKEG